MVQAKGVTNGVYLLPDEQTCAAAELNLTKYACTLLVNIKLQDSNVLVLVNPNNFCGARCGVIESDLDCICTLDNMEVGNHMAILVPNKARAGALRNHGHIYCIWAAAENDEHCGLFMWDLAAPALQEPGATQAHKKLRTSATSVQDRCKNNEITVLPCCITRAWHVSYRCRSQPSAHIETLVGMIDVQILTVSGLHLIRSYVITACLCGLGQRRCAGAHLRVYAARLAILTTDGVLRSNISTVSRSSAVSWEKSGACTCVVGIGILSVPGNANVDSVDSGRASARAGRFDATDSAAIKQLAAVDNSKRSASCSA